MKVEVIPTVIGSLETVGEGAGGVKNRNETIQTIALLKSARILRRDLETWEDLQSLRLQWKTISQRWSKKLIIEI